MSEGSRRQSRLRRQPRDRGLAVPARGSGAGAALPCVGQGEEGLLPRDLAPCSCSRRRAALYLPSIYLPVLHTGCWVQPLSQRAWSSSWFPPHPARMTTQPPESGKALHVAKTQHLGCWDSREKRSLPPNPVDQRCSTSLTRNTLGETPALCCRLVFLTIDMQESDFCSMPRAGQHVCAPLGLSGESHVHT